MSYFLAQSSLTYVTESSKRLNLISVEDSYRWYHVLMGLIFISFTVFYLVEWGLYMKFLFGYKNDIVALEQLEDVFGANTNNMLAIVQGLTVLNCVCFVIGLVYVLRY